MTEDSEIIKLEQRITELENNVSVLEEQAYDAKYVTTKRRDDVRVILALLDAIEEIQDILAKQLGAEFYNKLISLPINDWVNEARRAFHNKGQ